jgi:excisionase family DNA binding protein
MKSDDEGLIDKKQTGKYLKASVPSIDRWRAKGLLRAVKLGGLVRFRFQDVRDFVDRNVEAK